MLEKVLTKYWLHIAIGFTVYAGALSYFFLKQQLVVAGGLFAIPFLIAGVYYAVVDFRVLYGAMIFSLPLSINQKDLGGFGISVPGELIVVFVAGVGLMRIIWEYSSYRSVFAHWLTKAILLHVIWMVATVYMSSMLVVSIKFLVIRLIYVLVFYLLSVEWILSLKNRKALIWLYTLAFIPPIIYSILYHAQFGFTQASSYMVGDPFYNDHTIYAACIAMLIPFFFIESIVEKGVVRMLSISVLIGLAVAILLSYSRAGWGSLFVALACGVAFRFGLSFKKGILLLLIGVGAVLYNGHSILEKVKKNDTESSEGFLNHASSVSNISTDNSNMERLNRWACAIRMFEHEPIFGFGPGTYSFQYGQFQRSAEMTWVSVRDGSVGGVHSEYLKPLAEMGGVGFLLFLLIVFGAIKVGLDSFHDKHWKNVDRWLLLGAILGFVTYLVHGAVNFFLDTDKSSVLFWGFIAIMVAMDISRKNEGAKN